MSSNGKVLLAALTGAAVGVVAGMLMAPASGEETIEDLNKKGEELKKDLEGFSKKSSESLKDLSEKLSDTIQKNINGLKNVKSES